MNKIKKVFLILTVTITILGAVTIGVYADDSDSDNKVSATFNEATKELAGHKDSDIVQRLDKTSGANGNAAVGNAWGYMASSSYFWGQANSTDYAVTYSTLKSGAEESDNSATTRMNKARYFASSYGFMLYRTGLDHSGENSSQFAMFKMGRYIFGGLLLIVYMLASVINKAFSWVFSVLEIMNPLDWAVNGAKSHPDSAFASIANEVKQIYDAITGIGFLGAALCISAAIAFSLIGLRVSDQSGGGGSTSLKNGLLGAVWHYFKRVFTMVALPTLLLALWVLLVGSIKQTNFQASQNVSEYAIYSNFSDFKGHVTHSRLALPASLEKEIYTSTSAGSVPILKHDTIVRINAEGAGREGARKYVGQGISDAMTTQDSTDTASNLLMAWMGSDTYSASNYAAAVQRQYVSEHSKEDWSNKEIADNLKKELVDENSKYISNGGLIVNNGNVVRGDKTEVAFSQSNKGDNQNKGLSTLGMYNYLGTMFNSTSMKHNAIDNLSGSANQYEHYAVGLVGRGFTALGNYLFAFGLMMAGIVLGWGYGYWTIRALMESIPKMFGSLLLGGLGAVKGFGMVITNSLGVLISVGGSVAMYALTSDILIAIGKSLDTTFFSGKEYDGTGFAVILPKGIIAGDIGALSNMYNVLNVSVGIGLIMLSLYVLKEQKNLFTKFNKERRVLND